MEIVCRNQLAVAHLRGRTVQTVVGKDAPLPSTRMTVAFAH